jgi:predicted ATPase/DNA-binding SARP family transcriptional activator
VEVGVLGPAVVMTEDGPVVIPSRRERALLAVLALEHGMFVDHDTLADAVFGDAPPSRPRHALATLVLRLRERLGPGAVETARGGYRLDSTHVTVDAVTFEHAVKSGSGLGAAMRLWHGRPFVDLEGWSPAEPARARLQELHDHAEEELVAAALRSGEAGSLVAELEALVAAAPFRERRWVLLIEALYTTGRQADALAAFNRVRRLLIEELGVEPGPELVAANEAVLAHGSPITTRAVPNSLPTPLTSFIGRGADLGALASLVGTHRLVTLIGTGGVGKSRLALRVAADVLDCYRGGVWWVELASAVTFEEMLARVAGGIGLALQPSRRPDEQLINHLSNSNAALLVLDNCEHLIDPLACLAETLLSQCSSLSILATSREPMRVAGEQLWHVASLSAPARSDTVVVDELGDFDAAVLFVDRARHAHPDFVVDERSAPAIAVICSRLDGIPLAIELAAARTRTVPLPRIVAGLDDTLTLLTGGLRTGLRRHQTLVASIRWSYDLLDPADQSVLSRLAVCPTRFELDAAEAIARGAGERTTTPVADRLSRLVDRGLIEYDHVAGTYRLLETIRQFGLERLRDSGEFDAAYQRHAHFWADRAVAINRWPRYEAGRLAHMLTDVFAMLDWAMANDSDLADRVLAAISPQAFGLGRWPDQQRACDWLLADRPRGPHWPAAVASVTVGAVMAGRRDILGLTDEALRLAEQLHDERTIQELSVGHAYTRGVVGDLQPTRTLIAAAMASDNGSTALRAATGLIDALACLGQLDELWEMCRLGAGLAASVPFNVNESNVGPFRAVAFHLSGDVTTPVEHLPERPVRWELFNRTWAGMAARVAVDRDDAVLIGRARALIGPTDLRMSEVYRHVVAWASAVVSGDLASGADAAASAVDAASGVGQRAQSLTELAATLAALERWDETAHVLERLQTLCADINEPAPGPRARAAILRARLALVNHRAGDASQRAHDALHLARRAGLVLIQIDALETIALVTDPAQAARLLGATTAERQRRGYRGRLTTAASQSFVDRFTSTHADAWNVGTAESLDDAIAHSGRPGIST